MSKSTPNTGNALSAGNAQDVVTTKQKITAAQIEKDCPARLQQIGREIRERFDKARKQTETAGNHLIAANQLIVQAKELCDGGGFRKFRELFCPELRKSQAYVLLAIGGGKKTLEKHRTEERERKQKTRANQKAKFRDVPEKSEPEPELQDAPTDAGAVEATHSTPEQTSAPTRPLSLAKKIALVGFSATVRELVRVTSNKKAASFAQASVTTDDLARLGKLFTDIANLKKSQAVEPAPVMALTDNGAVPADQSAGNMKANTALRSKSQSGGVT